MKIDKYHKVASSGSLVYKNYWIKGYITEAKIAINEFAFNELKLRKIHSDIYTKNKASNIIQQRLGYKLEGVLRKEARCRATGKIQGCKYLWIVQRRLEEEIA